MASRDCPTPTHWTARERINKINLIQSVILDRRCFFFFGGGGFYPHRLWTIPTFNICANDRKKKIQEFIWQRFGMVHVGQGLQYLMFLWQAIFDKHVSQKSEDACC